MQVKIIFYKLLHMLPYATHHSILVHDVGNFSFRCTVNKCFSIRKDLLHLHIYK